MSNGAIFVEKLKNSIQKSIQTSSSSAEKPSNPSPNPSSVELPKPSNTVINTNPYPNPSFVPLPKPSNTVINTNPSTNPSSVPLPTNTNVIIEPVVSESKTEKSSQPQLNINGIAEKIDIINKTLDSLADIEITVDGVASQKYNKDATIYTGPSKSQNNLMDILKLPNKQTIENYINQLINNIEIKKDDKQTVNILKEILTHLDTQLKRLVPSNPSSANVHNEYSALSLIIKSVLEKILEIEGRQK